MEKKQANTAKKKKKKKRHGVDCGTDHELLIAKFRLKLKKMGDLAHSCMS